MFKRNNHVLCSGLAVLALTGASLSVSAVADDMAMATGTVTIMSPADGAMLSSNGENKLDYAITLGKGDDHFHVWVDEEKSPAQRDLKGSYVLPKLTPGKHAITIKVVDKGHVPTGPEQTVSVLVE